MQTNPEFLYLQLVQVQVLLPQTNKMKDKKVREKFFFITNQMLNWWFIEKDRQGNWQSEKSNQVDKTDKIER